jgi:hypothetical protein
MSENSFRTSKRCSSLLMDVDLDMTDDLDVYLEEDNNNNVDVKEEEDNNMDILCV